MTPRPYRSGLRAKAALVRQQRILDAAIGVLRGAGAGGFSLESVARAAGVTRLTVYNQFGSRRALLEAVFDARAETGGLQPGSGRRWRTRTPRRGLRRSDRHLLRFLGRRVALARGAASRRLSRP